MQGVFLRATVGGLLRCPTKKALKEACGKPSQVILDVRDFITTLAMLVRGEYR